MNEIKPLLCVEFRQETTDCNHFPLSLLNYELQAHGFAPPFYSGPHATCTTLKVVAGTVTSLGNSTEYSCTNIVRLIPAGACRFCYSGERGENLICTEMQRRPCMASVTRQRVHARRPTRARVRASAPPAAARRAACRAEQRSPHRGTSGSHVQVEVLTHDACRRTLSGRIRSPRSRPVATTPRCEEVRSLKLRR